MQPMKIDLKYSSPRAIIASLALAALMSSAPAPAQLTLPEAPYEGTDRIEEWKDKRILVLTPHPDDETFSAGGTLALLARNGNDITIFIYTSDNAGSRDPDMTKERLAAIRKKEEENACAILGIPADKLIWLGVDDGMLEYEDRRELTRTVAGVIRDVRPDAVFSIDPGAPYEQWHKSDHRTGAQLTVDAMRAAAWRLYFPELEAAGKKPWTVPVGFFFYSNTPNYEVDITDVADLKARASAAHASQFGDLVDKYDESKVTEKHLEGLASMLKLRAKKKNGRIIEEFRRSTVYGG